MTDREPPHNLEAEQAVLGAVLLGGAEILAAVAGVLAEDDFYRPAHRTVWRVATALRQAAQPVDDVTVLVELQRLGQLADVGGAPFLHTLVAAVPAVAMAGHYARLVAALGDRRRLIDAGRRIAQAGTEESDAGRAVEHAREILARTVPASRDSNLFRLWTPQELLDAPRGFSWRIRGMLAHPTYGPVGGERKSLKSYVAMFIALGVASGEAVFDHFKVDEAHPVVAYVGEGGRIPYTRRLERIAAAMGVKLADVPLHTSFEVAPIGSERFRRSLDRDLERRRPGLVIVDPLYAFHPPTVKAADLFERGAMLAGVSAPCGDAGASLLIVDHFNKTGSGRGLDRITQSGQQEWADTWLLLSHREPADVQAGQFRLTLEIGSRQWGGSCWDLDLEIGRFDPDLGEYDGAISWDLARAASNGRDAKLAAIEEAVQQILRDQPYELTESAVVREIGGNQERTRAALKRLFDEGRITAAKVRQPEGDRVVCRLRLGIAGQPVPVDPDKATTSGSTDVVARHQPRPSRLDVVGQGSPSTKQMRMSEGG